MRNLILPSILLLSILTSCGTGSKSEIEKLKAENDSLQTYKLKLEDEVNDYFSTLNDVQEGIAKIKAAQNIIPIRPLSENTPQDVRNRVNDDVAFINDLIKTNQEEIDKMRHDAEMNESEDKKKKELIEARNEGDSAAYNAEKSLKDLGDAATPEEKAAVEEKVKALRDLLKGEDAAAIKSAIDALMNAMHPIAQKAYAKAQASQQQAGAQQGGAAGPQPGAQANGSDGNTVDAEFHEEDNK